MGYMFQASAPEKPESECGMEAEDNSKKQNVETQEQNYPQMELPQLESGSSELTPADIINLPAEQTERTHDGTIAEFCQQFVAIIPGSIGLNTVGGDYDLRQWDLCGSKILIIQIEIDSQDLSFCLLAVCSSAGPS